jgi:hypothetical protein
MEHAITFLTCLSALFFVLWICTAISYKDQKAKLNNLANRYDKLYVENDRLSKEYKYFVGLSTERYVELRNIRSNSRSC